MAIQAKAVHSEVSPAGRIQWHERLADLHLADADPEQAKAFQQEAARQTKIRDEHEAAWRRDIRNRDSLKRNIEARNAAMQAGHLASVAAAGSDVKAYITHRLVAVQVRAHAARQSIDNAVRAEMTRLLAHANAKVREEAKKHPNSRLLDAVVDTVQAVQE